MTWRDWLASICDLHHHKGATMAIDTDTREELGEIAGDIVERAVSHGFSEEEAVDLVADLLDWLIDLPDGIWYWLVSQAAEMLRPDVQRLRARARKAERAGKAKKAARLRRRADKVEARQEH